MQQPTPISGDLVFLGGGHAQVAALKSFAMNPVPGLRLTLVSRDLLTPYSGMLPAFVEGVWNADDIHIDLSRLAAMAGARLIHASAVGIDAADQRIDFDGRPSIHYDLLSVNIGGQPDLDAIPGAARHAIPVKPISRFRQKLDDLVADGYPQRIAIIGGGAAGCELALALAKRWHAKTGKKPEIMLFGRAARLLPEMPPKAARLMFERLRDAGCTVFCGATVSSIEDKKLFLEDERSFEFDVCFLVSAVSPPFWLQGSGLQLDGHGFIAVGATLQSLSHDNVFAAGDIAALTHDPRPKSGVFAVRAGPTLSYNLRSYSRARRLRRWKPQKKALALLGTADGQAIAIRGGHVSHGRAACWLKKFIDRRWMAKYTNLKMQPPAAPRPLAGLNRSTPGGTTAIGDPAFEAMRCLGCGAKTGHETLALAMQQAVEIACKLGADPKLMPDPGLTGDSAILPPTGSWDVVQSVDVISEIVSDPFMLGRIAAVHALSDLYAANATPHYALAVVTLAVARADLQRDQLTQLMAGGLLALSEAGVRLVGGHTSEAESTSLGFAVTGTRHAVPEPPDLADDPVLLLTKPLGTGLVMAAHMHLQAKGEDVAATIQTMAMGNGAAAALLAGDMPMMTDVTGFGLARHAMNLAERCGFSGVETDLASLPILPGAEAAAKSGIRSSLHAQNKAAIRLVSPPSPSPRHHIIFDPQTSGGLLAALPRKTAERACKKLVKTGHDAAIIGRLTNAWVGLHEAGQG